jgi:hypothetical protein
MITKKCADEARTLLCTGNHKHVAPLQYLHSIYTRACLSTALYGLSFMLNLVKQFWKDIMLQKAFKPHNKVIMAI